MADRTLPVSTVLNGRYTIIKTLGQGGFGITYLAKDMKYNQFCAIKEYFPVEYSSRDVGSCSIHSHLNAKAQHVYEHGREKFVEEAKKLQLLLKDPIVVDYRDFFQANNTAYIVMEYVDGQTLRQMAVANGGRLNAQYAMQVFVAVASSLMELHKINILHRDLSPENIMVSKDGQIKIIDFGAARDYVSSQNAGMSILLKRGYAPPEQYDRNGNQGPWSDVYALCATFYALICGRIPPEPLFRYKGKQLPSLKSMGCQVTECTSNVIQKGLELEARNRYRNFRELLNDVDVAYSKPTPKTEPLKKVVRKRDIDNKKVIDEKAIRQNLLKEKKAYIALVSGKHQLNKVIIPKGKTFVIGRERKQCQYTIQNGDKVSRQHCKILYDGTSFEITDISRNGTYLENGKKLTANKRYKIPRGTKFYLCDKKHMLIVGIE